LRSSDLKEAAACRLLMARLSLDPLCWVPGPFRGYFFLSSFKLPATCNTLFNFLGGGQGQVALNTACGQLAPFGRKTLKYFVSWCKLCDPSGELGFKPLP